MSKEREAVYDELLVLRAKANDAAALSEMVHRWHQRLAAHAMRLTRDQEGMDEVMQEVWIAIVRNIGKLDTPRSFFMWAVRIVGRKSANWVKKRQRTRHDGTQAGLSEHIATSPAARIEDGIEEVLGVLSVQHREVVVLHYLHDQSVEEIATTLGVRAGTIKSRLHYAREAMRLALEEDAHE